MQPNQPPTTYLADYRPPVYLIDHVELQVQLHEQGTRVQAKLQIRRNPQADPQETTLCLQGEALQHQWIAINGTRLADEDLIFSEHQVAIPNPPTRFTLTSAVQIAPETNQALEGLYRSGNMFCTQCEAEGFRRITWYIDRPDVMATFQVRIEAEKARYPVLLSNGNLLEQGDLPAGRHYALWHDPLPKPCYLFALVAGELHYIQGQHTTSSGKSVTLRIYTEPDNIHQCDHALYALKQAMRWDEQHYGREYDLELYNIVAATDFNMGAMENKGLNIFNAKYVLASPTTATDQDYQAIESVITHEYFHNWTGNRITCRDWFQLSLKEGLTVYRDQTFSADQIARSVKRIEDVNLLRMHQFTEDASPMAHPVRPDAYIEIRNFYTATVYEKGAEVVRMQALLLGPTQYRQAMDLYFARHDGQAVTIEDFMACMAEVSGRDFSQFQHWYTYAGTPLVQVQDEYDAATGTYRLHCTQQVPDTPGQTNKPAFLIPIAVGLLNPAGHDMLTAPSSEHPDGTVLLELQAPTQTFAFHNLPERPTPSLLRGFSAPVKLDYPYTDPQLLHLIAQDSDHFNRWEAAQNLYVRLILQAVTQPTINMPLDLPDGLAATLRTVLQTSTTEPALSAALLRLPSLAYLSDQMAIVDIDGLYRARQALRHGIALALYDTFYARYQQLTETDTYQTTPEAIGRRSLKNVLLDYLVSQDTESVWELALTQYQAQHNMTDVMAALALLADSTHPQRQTVLDTFAERWQADTLVMDKWFSVQARAARPDTLATVQRLMHHPAFSLQNPNKVRALIGAFSTQNPLCFHAADGSGYRFLSTQIQALDQFNPQIAARLVRGLARWQRYDSTRQQPMRTALQALLNDQTSKDVYEIAAQALGQH